LKIGYIMGMSYTCDRCGKSCNKERSYIAETYEFENPFELANNIKRDAQMKIYLCMNCRDLLKSWLSNSKLCAARVNCVCGK